MRQLLICFTLCVSAGFISAAATTKHPFQICKTLNSDFNTCVSRAIESAMKTLVKGYPPLGIFSVDPLHITAIAIEQGTGPISVNLQFRELDIRGLVDAKLHNFKSDLKDFMFTSNVTVPKVTLDGMYSVDGKVLILPIKGDGKSHLQLDDVTADFIITGKQYKKDSKSYLKINRFDFNINTKKLTIKLENLFNGDKALGDNMNKFLNENSQDILKELKPAVSATFGAAFSEIANRIFAKISFDEIFPH